MLLQFCFRHKILCQLVPKAHRKPLLMALLPYEILLFCYLYKSVKRIQNWCRDHWPITVWKQRDEREFSCSSKIIFETGKTMHDEQNQRWILCCSHKKWWKNVSISVQKGILRLIIQLLSIALYQNAVK